VLREVERARGHSNRILARELERSPGLADPRDRGLVTVLAYGVLRHRARLDAHIDAHARAPEKIRGEVREVMRIAAFELRELAHPPHAAIGEAVKAVRGRAGGGGLAGAVHAILAAIDRGGEELDLALAGGDPARALAQRWSIPPWLAARWLARLGAERALARARALAEPPPLDLRIDLSRATAADVRAELASDHPGIALEARDDQPQLVRTRGGGDLFHGPLHGRGLISVQGLGAQQPAIELAPQPGTRVLDACAGLGVKTLQLAELMQRRGTIVAADVDARRLGELAELRARGELDRPGLELRTVAGDLAGDLPELDAEPFDAVLLDVPCTGLGNLARHPEIRWVRSAADIATAAALQARLLARNLARVRSGGRLVYAVCSGEPEEGPEVVRAALAAGGVALAHEREWTPEGDASEGFWVARLERR
jgi:16S rRNA (cytosine967-C5)-methyltransferase